LSIFGATGYAGGHIAATAAHRGHNVTGYSRNAPTNPVAGVTYIQGDSAISGADFALAVVQEIEYPAHRRARFTVAY
jgi:putative NADH-flavin reductase